MEAKQRKSRKLPKSIRPEEFKELIKTIPRTDIIARIGFLLGYGAGMRVSEIARCSSEHFRETSIFIPQSKYGVERIVPIPKGWKVEFEKSLPLYKYVKKSSKHKEATAIRNLQIRFAKYSKLAKLPSYYTIHSLRHGFATRLIESGVPINQIQVLMGHSNVSTTSIYLKANPIDAIKSYEELF